MEEHVARAIVAVEADARDLLLGRVECYALCQG